MVDSNIIGIGRNDNILYEVRNGIAVRILCCCIDNGSKFYNGIAGRIKEFELARILVINDIGNIKILDRIAQIILKSFDRVRTFNIDICPAVCCES